MENTIYLPFFTYTAHSKSAAPPTDYTDLPLVTKEENKRLRAIKAEISKKKRKLDNDAATLAVTAIINQPELTHSVGYSLGAEVTDNEAPHFTHDIRHISTSATYPRTMQIGMAVAL